MSIFPVAIKEPVMTAAMKAVQVQGRISLDILDTGFSFETSPNNRKSTMAIEPNTMTSAKMCKISTIGKTHSEPGASPAIQAESVLSRMAVINAGVFTTLSILHVYA